MRCCCCCFCCCILGQRPCVQQGTAPSCQYGPHEGGTRAALAVARPNLPFQRSLVTILRATMEGPASRMPMPIIPIRRRILGPLGMLVHDAMPQSKCIKYDPLPARSRRVRHAPPLRFLLRPPPTLTPPPFPSAPSSAALAKIAFQKAQKRSGWESRIARLFITFQRPNPRCSAALLLQRRSNADRRA